MSECNCGSKMESHWKYDGYGIPLCRVCSECEDEKMKQYRQDILTRYSCDEQIEEAY